jgi:hypothetical protein
MTQGSDALDKVKTLFNAIIFIPDTRSVRDTEETVFRDSFTRTITSFLVYFLTPLNPTDNTFIGHLVTNQLSKLRTALFPPQVAIFTPDLLTHTFVATKLFQTVLTTVNAHIPEQAVFFDLNNQNQPVLMDRVSPHSTTPTAVPPAIAHYAPPTGLGVESLEASKQKQLLKNSLKDLDKTEPIKGMFTPETFTVLFGSPPTVSRGMCNIAAYMGAELAEDVPPMSDAMIEKVVTGKMMSNNGKVTSNNGSILRFSPNKKILDSSELIFAVHTYTTFATAVYGKHIYSATKMFLDFAAIYLNPHYTSNSTESQLTLDQHIALFDKCVYRVAHDSTAIDDTDPASRWQHGFSLVIHNTVLINKMCTVNTQSRITAHDTAISELKSDLTKRKSTTTSTPSKQKQQQKTKSPKFDPSNLECGFYKDGKCKKGKRCDRLHDGKPASSQPESPSS